jgi:hypothetical protein
MRKNASLPAHTFDQAGTPMGSGRGRPQGVGRGRRMDTRQISTRRLVAGCEGTREGLRSARGSIAATGARFTPGQRAREGLGGQVARSLRRPSGNRSRDDARRGRPRMLPKYSSQWTKRSRDEVSAIQDRCALRQRIEQGKDHRVTPVKPRGVVAARPPSPCPVGDRLKDTGAHGGRSPPTHHCSAAHVRSRSASSSPNPRGPGVLDVHPRQGPHPPGNLIVRRPGVRVRLA